MGHSMSLKTDPNLKYEDLDLSDSSFESDYQSSSEITGDELPLTIKLDLE